MYIDLSFYSIVSWFSWLAHGWENKDFGMSYLVTMVPYDHLLIARLNFKIPNKGFFVVFLINLFIQIEDHRVYFGGNGPQKKC